ncbi:MAG: 5-formyltetrahydrofolate cyclo-ligase [Burkholderiaceae bacterium]|nr:MAG: 5-formyltetrahydrofolate cyclo-ligase [Burkholderiaceae bacterium]TAM10407.1 MAG: 5-formyltetrahydrofolate cyclo-ligase [Pusillimonas sp.]
MNDSIENNAAALRTRLKELRKAQSPHDTRRGALLIRGRLYTWLATTRAALQAAGRPTPTNVAAFWSMESEPELQPLLAQWVEDGISVSLPVISAADSPLQFRIWTPGTAMQTSPYGFEEPVGLAAPLPDIILVPTLGYTRHGDRIGYGKGYYDRTLAALKAKSHAFTSIGIAWACGDLSGQDHTPAAHDVKLDSILTDKGWAVPAPKLA